MPGTNVRISSMAASHTSTVLKERSRSVRSTASDTPRLICANPSLNDSTIVGMDRISVTMPPVATAPAPM